MADSYMFDRGNLIASTKFIYLVKNKGVIPSDAGASKEFDGQPGYEIFNLKTKAQYWVSRKLAHTRYKLKTNSKAGQVLFG